MLNHIHTGKDYSFTVAAIYRLWRKGTIATPHVPGLLQTRANMQPREAASLARIWDNAKAREQGYV